MLLKFSSVIAPFPDDTKSIWLVAEISGAGVAGASSRLEWLCASHSGRAAAATVQGFVVFISNLWVLGTVNANMLIFAIGVCAVRAWAVVPQICRLCCRWVAEW